MSSIIAILWGVGSHDKTKILHVKQIDDFSFEICHSLLK